MKKTLAILTTLFLASCATSYGKMGLLSLGGYQDERVGANEFKIKIISNGYTSLETANEYFFRRASEICGEENFIHSFDNNNMKSHMEYAGSVPVMITTPEVSGFIRCKDQTKINYQEE